MKLKLKRIAPLSAGKILAVFYGAMALLFIPLFLLISALATFAGGKAGMNPMPLMFGFGILIAAPFFYAAMGFVSGVIGAWIYNLIAGWIGGFELEFEPENTREAWPNLPPVPPAV